MRGFWMVGLAGVVAASWGCGADGGDASGAGGSGANAGAGGPGGAGTGGTTISVGGGFGTGGGTTQGAGCSSDLQAVVDEDGNVLQACPADQGCLEGQCVAACEAAAGSKSAIGCEYITPSPPFYLNDSASSSFHGACYAVFVANTWGRHAKLTVERAGQTLDVTSFARIPSGVAPNTTYAPLPTEGLPPNEVAVLFLAHDPSASHPIGGPLTCPITPALQIDVAAHGSARGEAFEVTSDTPITAYDIVPYGGAPSFLPSASLLFPRTAWGDNYVAYGPHASSGQLWMMLVGAVDGTTIDLVPSTTLPGGANVPTAPAGQVTSITIGAGEVVQWLGADPTGTVLQGDHPFGLFTGNTYLRVTSATSPSGGGQDSAHQQIPPLSALGSSYVGGGVVTRRGNLQPESVPYRVVGVVDGTQLTWDPMPAGAPSVIGAGEVVELESTTPFVVSSQDADHPFALSQYMPGTSGSLDRPGCSPNPPFAGMTCGLGDEEWVVLVPPEQFLSRYVFFTDPTYATTNLVLVRRAGEAGFSDVNVACLGPVSGWQPVGASGEYEVAHVDLIRGGMGAAPGCATSRHEATSAGAFGVMVWGTDYYASYGYPAGGNVGTINDVVIVPTPE